MTIRKVLRFLKKVFSLQTTPARPKTKRKSNIIQKRFQSPKEILLFGTPTAIPTFSSEEALENYLTQTLEHFAVPLLTHYAQLIHKEIKTTTIKPVKSMRWRCTRDNRILLNRDLVHLSPKLIEYVIVHEVAHLQEKHHQNTFWNLVAKMMPDYQTYQKELKKLIPASRKP